MNLIDFYVGITDDYNVTFYIMSSTLIFAKTCLRNFTIDELGMNAEMERNGR